MRVTSRKIDSQQLSMLLEKVASKDVQAFQELHEATAAKLLGVALRILNQSELAEDVLQESFFSVWHSASTYRGNLSAPMTWMTAIVRNKAYDVIREPNFVALKNSAELDEIDLAGMIDPRLSSMATLELRREATALVVGMSQLEGRQRQVIAMAFFHDLSHSEIAHDLALPLGTVKTWIRRGLGHLQTSLKRQGILSFGG